MKKIFLIVISLTIYVLGLSQNAKTFQTGPFNGIDAGGIFDIELTSDTKESVQIETSPELMQFVKIYVKNEILYLNLETSRIPSSLKTNSSNIKAKISMRNFNYLSLSGASKLRSKAVFNEKDVKFKVSGASNAVMPEVTCRNAEISVSGASAVTLNGKFEEVILNVDGTSNVKFNGNAESVEVGISGAGRLNLRSQIGKLEIKSSGVAGVVLEGKADFAELISSGSSIIQSPNFKINDAEVKASGAANIKIQVINTLKVNASGSSIVKYFGNPKIKSRKVSSAASFNRL